MRKMRKSNLKLCCEKGIPPKWPSHVLLEIIRIAMTIALYYNGQIRVLVKAIKVNNLTIWRM
jgi:hypothetical protein